MQSTETTSTMNNPAPYSISNLLRQLPNYRFERHRLKLKILCLSKIQKHIYNSVVKISRSKCMKKSKVQNIVKTKISFFVWQKSRSKTSENVLSRKLKKRQYRCGDVVYGETIQGNLKKLLIGTKRKVERIFFLFYFILYFHSFRVEVRGLEQCVSLRQTKKKKKRREKPNQLLEMFLGSTSCNFSDFWVCSSCSRFE